MNLSQLWENFKILYTEEIEKFSDQRDEYWRTHSAWNPLNWIEYFMDYMNALQTEPLVALLKLYALQIQGGLNAKGQPVRAADDMVTPLTESKSHVLKANTAFFLCTDAIIEGAKKASGFDTGTFFAAIGTWLARRIWKWYQKGGLFQQVKWFIELMGMPSTEAQLIELVKKFALSTKKLLNVFIVAVWIVFRLTAVVTAFIQLTAFAIMFRGGGWDRYYLQQRNKLVKDTKLGRKRDRK